MNQLEKNYYNNQTFEDIKHIDECGKEFWYARELMLSLGYSSWDKFKNVIERAIISCKNSESLAEEHFSQLGKSLDLPNGAKKYIENFEEIRKFLVGCAIEVTGKLVESTGNQKYEMKAEKVLLECCKSSKISLKGIGIPRGNIVFQ